jgi:uncharacterized membrane protein
MRKILKHLQAQILRGLLAAIPFILTYYVVRFIYLAAQTRLTIGIEKLLGFRIPGLGIILVVILLYVLGLISANWLGRRILTLVEKVAERIPVVKSIFHLGKQFSTSLALPQRRAFERVVMVECFQPGVWSVGFVTGEFPPSKKRGAKVLKVFVPTAPNPTAGFLIMVEESRVRNMSWTAQEAINTVISTGVVGPTTLTLR